MLKLLLSVSLAIWGGCQVLTVFAHDDRVLFNTVNLQAQAEREIPNDQMIVVLVTEQDGNDAAKVAKMINLDMAWALEIIKKHPFAKYQTKGYQTWPLYDADHEISGWHAVQEVELAGSNMEGLSGLIGKLQEKMQVREMNFSPADATRRKIENELILEAMQAFQERIEIVRKKMDDKNYRIISLTINTNGQPPSPVFYERAMAASSAAGPPPPALQAGTSRMVVTVNGSVQFTHEAPQ
jgi:predicted secreted protein